LQHFAELQAVADESSEALVHRRN